MDPAGANIPPLGQATSDACPPAGDEAPLPPASGAAFSLEESKAYHAGCSSQGTHPSRSPSLLS